MTGLSNTAQAFLMFLAFTLPAFATWFGIGAPTDHAALALLGSDFMAGVIVAIKELLGGQSAPTTSNTVTVGNAG